MPFKDYLDACRQIHGWCLEEARDCEDPHQRFLWLDAAEYWRERVIAAEAAEAAKASRSEEE